MRWPKSPFRRSPGDPGPPSFSLYAGGGGAIAHQELWAESLDPVLRESNRKGKVIVVDPKAGA